MSELAVRQAPAISNMDDLARVSKMFAESGMFKDTKEAAQAGVKILCGLESGFGAFAAMAGVHVIEGKPTMGANLMALAIKRSGKYNYKVTEHTDETCTVEIFERWDGQWQSIGTSRFSVVDAKAAGARFKDRNGGPTPWAKFPRNMLFARAISNALRWYCPDALSLTAYTPEELGAPVDDEGHIIEAEVVEAPEKPSEPQQEAEASNEPSKPPEAEKASAEATAEPLITEDRAIKMLGELSKLGFDIPNTIELAKRVTKRDVKSVGELTEDEASRVFGAAKRAMAPEPPKPIYNDEPPFDPDPEPENFAPNGKGSRLLTNPEASQLHKALGIFGVGDQYAFASGVMGRKIASFQALQVSASIKVYEAALEQYGTEEQKAEYHARQAAA